MPIHLAHTLARQLATVRKDGTLDCLRPGRQDAGDGRVRRRQARSAIDDGRRIDPARPGRRHRRRSREQIRKHVVEPDSAGGACVEERLQASGQSRRAASSRADPHADCGLTGRKIIVDTYGGVGKSRRRRVSPGRTRRRSTGRRRTRRGTWPRTSSRPGSRTAARSSSRTPSASPSPSRSWSTRWGPGRSPTRRSSQLVKKHFDLQPAAPSSSGSTSGGRSTGRRPPTATSAARSRTSRGSGSTWLTTSRRGIAGA